MKFKITDVVRVVESSEFLGRVGRIVRVYRQNTVLPYLVELDNGERLPFSSNGLELVE